VYDLSFQLFLHDDLLVSFYQVLTF
jgi:hypothetical protein